MNSQAVPNSSATAIPLTTREFEDSPRACLSRKQAIEIFNLKNRSDPTSSKLSSTELAPIYGVNEKTIRDIWSGRTWAKATGIQRQNPRPKKAKKPNCKEQSLAASSRESSPTECDPNLAGTSFEDELSDFNIRNGRKPASKASKEGFEASKKLQNNSRAKCEQTYFVFRSRKVN
mmetsp:Transcript_19494/g.54241  ORF Transcript_19494/g.54241 Transcript_19494/m.54241 type:complete len:175 (+) Transcript_19494:417-941(+)